MAKNNADAAELESLDDAYNDSTESEVEGATSRPAPERRQYRSDLEKKRRTEFRESLNKLQESLPGLCGKKATTTQVLKEAADFIETKRLENEAREKDLEALRKRNDEMEKMFLALDKAFPTKQQSDKTVPTKQQSDTTVPTKQQSDKA